MADWEAELVDINGAFLHGEFDNGEQIYMEIPQGFQEVYDPDLYVLQLLQTLYGTKQAAMQFWKKLLSCYKDMDFDRSHASARKENAFVRQIQGVGRECGVELILIIVSKNLP